jgi:anthranilate synthase/aminodeoxychorismate synthase-like glutamine amidotransferase
MLLVLDNYDSFTFNLVQYLGELGADPVVIRNDERTVREIAEMAPERIVLSPGPCTPAEAGVSVDVVRELGSSTPILGVCLGHQAIGEAYGGRTIRAARTMHGKTSPIRHDGTGLFDGLASPLTVARYHSLVTDPDALPDVLVPIAWSDDAEAGEEVQAMRHREHPVWGVQFHPESLFSDGGHRLLENFLRMPAGSEVAR